MLVSYLDLDPTGAGARQRMAWPVHPVSASAGLLQDHDGWG